MWALTSVAVPATGAIMSAHVARESSPDRQIHSIQPYAQIKIVKLNELVPAPTGIPDLYVRLIAVDGEVLR